jgi:vacuolar-type H+-ATPase subunit F/Vma7
MPETTLENPLVVMGDIDTVSGFKALGFKVYVIKEPGEFSAILEEIVAKQTAVCLIQENIYQAQESQIHNYKNLALPVFVPFDKSAKMDKLGQIIKNIRLRATGTF